MNDLPMPISGTRVRLAGWAVTGTIVGHGTMALSTETVHPVCLVELDDEHSAWHAEKGDVKPGLWVRNIVVHPENLVSLSS